MREFSPAAHAAVLIDDGDGDDVQMLHPFQSGVVPSPTTTLELPGSAKECRRGEDEQEDVAAKKEAGMAPSGSLTAATLMKSAPEPRVSSS